MLYSTQGELSASGWRHAWHGGNGLTDDVNTSGKLGMEVVGARAMSHSKQRSASEIPSSAQLTLSRLPNSMLLGTKVCSESVYASFFSTLLFSGKLERWVWLLIHIDIG